MSLKESHVARGVEAVSLSFSPDSISRNQRSREFTLNFFSIDRCQSLPAWGSTKKNMSRKDTYVYKFCVCDFVMEMFWRSDFWIDQNVWNRNQKLRAAISVFFYHDQNYELTISQIYVQESKNEREKSAERKEKFKICGVVVVCSIRVFCSTGGGCANTYWSVSVIKTIFEGDSVSIPFTKILIKLDALLGVPKIS